MSEQVWQQDIRWQQRFQHYRSAFRLLEQAIAIEKPSVVERAGLIQFYELTFELGWNLLKDYLEAEGYRITSPRQALKQAYQAGVIEDGQAWIDSLDDRNLTAHTYNEATAQLVEEKIRNDYFGLLRRLLVVFEGLSDS